MICFSARHAASLEDPINNRMIHDVDCGSSLPTIVTRTKGFNRVRPAVGIERWTAQSSGGLGYENPRYGDVGGPNTVCVCVHVYLQLLRGIYIYQDQTTTGLTKKETMQ